MHCAAERLTGIKLMLMMMMDAEFHVYANLF